MGPTLLLTEGGVRFSSDSMAAVMCVSWLARGCLELVVACIASHLSAILFGRLESEASVHLRYTA